MTTLCERLRGASPVVLDGGTGTELARRGVDTGLPLWSAHALADAHGRAVLEAIHAEYARAGAAVLTTNTFRTTPRALARAGRGNDWTLLNRRAVEIARAASRRAAAATARPRRAQSPGADPPPLVAGSMAPLEDCYRPDLVPSQADCRREHLRQADLLARLGVDLLLIETMNTAREACAAVAAARVVGIDALVSLCPGGPETLLSGERLTDAVPRVIAEGRGCVAGLMLNCAGPDLLEEALPALSAAAAGLPFGVYAHLGEPDPVTGWRLPKEHDAQAYAAWSERCADLGARLLGGCCGTTPAHIEAMALRLAARTG
jgi:S-methylmethionine-dependent homocysteine/selenocysteine methylase